MENYCYLNGRIIETKKASLGLRDIGILRGFGIFDYLRTFKARPFLLDEHLERFMNSAKAMGIEIPADKSQMKEAVKELISKNGYRESGVRLVLTGGKTVNGLEFEGNPSFFILVEELQEIPEVHFEEGVKLITLEHQRIMPEVKTTNYITAVLMQKVKKEKDAFEILYTKEGKILETTTANFFIIKDKTLVTPKENILIGTTRNLIMKLVENDFQVEEREVATEEALSAPEAFITASNKNILPVVRIDENIVGNGEVGENTRLLMEKFDEYITSGTWAS